MSKSVKYFTAILFFIVQNLCAQSNSDADVMDLHKYSTWVAAGVFIMMFIMFAVLLYSESGQPVISHNAVLCVEKIKLQQFKIYSDNLQNILTGLISDLLRIRFLFISTAIIYSIVAFLLIIN